MIEELWFSVHDCLFIHLAGHLGGLWKVWHSQQSGAPETNALLGSTFQAGLMNGGPSTLVYGFLVAFAGSLALSASLAEMASM